ncbi:hypothetical protein pb186bvf_016355 [Paramecium bursaria]
MSRTWLESAKRQPLDSHFDLKSFRSQVKDRFHPMASLTQELGNSKYNSSKKEVSQSIPSFENLQARIRDFSYSRLGNTVQQAPKSQLNYSPNKAVGLSQKQASAMKERITETLGPRIQSPVNSIKSMKFSLNNDRYENRFYSANEGNKFQSRKKNLADVVQLNEIITLRNKIEACQVSRSQLTSTYASELIKLAQAITSSMRAE